MRRQDFYYDLPQELIAQHPPAERRDSRLLCLDGPTGAIEHSQFPTILDRLDPGDLLVVNDTRVIPARLHGRKASGGKVEVLIERITGATTALAHVRASKAPKPDSELLLGDAVRVTVSGREGDLFALQFDESLLPLLERIGHMPLPPYIDRADNPADRERYQTVYAAKPGAVAAPTAGLHFDPPLLAALAAKGVERATVTLHVGAGTFQPVRVDDIHSHQMHKEWLSVDAATAEQVNACRARGNRVVAVGTTSVRALESAATGDGGVRALQGDTDIFIYPGYRWQVVDALITNFHLPESTLLMLVASFAGYRHTMAAYRAAVAERYRFFSYGDAMFIRHNPAAADEVIG